MAPSAAAPSAAAQTTAVVVKDFTLDPLDVAVAGTVSLAVTNAGPTVHNVAIRDDAGKVFGTTADLKTGESETLTVEIPAGSYILFCSLPGHESLGIKGTLTVSEWPLPRSVAPSPPTALPPLPRDPARAGSLDSIRPRPAPDSDPHPTPPNARHGSVRRGPGEPRRSARARSASGYATSFTTPHIARLGPLLGRGSAVRRRPMLPVRAFGGELPSVPRDTPQAANI